MNDPMLKAHQVLPPFALASGGQEFVWDFDRESPTAPCEPALDRSLFPPLFNLSGKLSPVSIRDQMVRGQLLAVRAFEERIIRTHYPLLVIGAGAAGISAALTARHCEGGGDPTVVELLDEAFSLQANCTTRWISPTQYDWPLQHWKQGNYPITSGWRPLPWVSDLSHSIAAWWRMALRASRFRILYKSRVTHMRVVPRNDRVHPTAWAVEINDRPHDRVFGAIVLAVGFGEERYVFKPEANAGGISYHSRPFWSDDSLQNASYGLASTPSILISGSGDGGLQDFLRITTNCKSAHDIIDGLALPANLAARLQDAEDWAKCGYHWGASERHDHPVLEKLHQEHVAVVRNALNDANVVLALDRIVRTQSQLPTIRLVHNCTHFANAYPLNRFLVLLIAKYIETERKLPNPLVPRARLRTIHSHGNGCAGIYADRQGRAICEGRDHQIDLVCHDDCTVDPTTSLTPQHWPKSFNMIIIRHGIDFRPPGSQYRNVPFIDLPRQTMAYDYPQ